MVNWSSWSITLVELFNYNLASHIFVVCIFCTLRFMSKGNFFSRNNKPFASTHSKCCHFIFANILTVMTTIKILRKIHCQVYWGREEEYLQMFTDMNSFSQIDFSSFKSANIPYGFRKLCQKSSKTHWQILSRFKIHSKAYQQRKRVNLRILLGILWTFLSSTLRFILMEEEWDPLHTFNLMLGC